MKNILVTILVIAFLQWRAFGQSTEPLVPFMAGVTLGVYTADYYWDGLHVGRPTTREFANLGAPAAITGSFKWPVSSQVAFNIGACFDQQYGNWLHNEIHNGNVFDLRTTLQGAFVRYNSSIAVGVTIEYFSKGIYHQYMEVDLGVTWQTEFRQYTKEFYNQHYNNGINDLGPKQSTQKRMHINGYISPIAMRIGRKVCFTFEIGFGYKGVFNSGICYTIKPRKK